MARLLSVYLHQNLAGELIQSDDGQMSFAYSEGWLKNPNAIALSHSLPLRTERFNNRECRGFFAGLLPEDTKREIIARNLGISSRNDFAMLEKIGGECAGAVTFLHPDQALNELDHSYHPLSDSDLIKIIRELPKKPLMAGDKDVRLSLAGAQDKLAVMIKDESVSIPLGNSPSSHILKPAIDRFEGLVYNEALCLQLASDIGVPAAKASVHKIDNIDYLLIERHDRTIDSDGKLQRIHQEDFCQALGLVPERKYQNESGPSLKQCFKLVRDVCSTPVLDLKNLLDAVIFNYIIGNNDAHGKNFSLLYDSQNTRLAPLYDVVCTIYYPALTTNMAMKIGREYKSDEVFSRHFKLFAEEIGFAPPMVVKRVVNLIDKLMEVLNTFQKTNSVMEDVSKIIHDRCVRIKDRF